MGLPRGSRTPGKSEAGDGTGGVARPRGRGDSVGRGMEGAWPSSEERWGAVAWARLGGPRRSWGGEGLPFLSPSFWLWPLLTRCSPHPLLPGSPGSMGDQGVSTQLLVPSGSVCFSYTSAPWRLFLRKEVGMRVGEGVAGWAGPGWGTPVSAPHAQTRGAAAPRPRGIFCLAWGAGGRGTGRGCAGRHGHPRSPCPPPGLLPPGELQPPLQPPAPL